MIMYVDVDGFGTRPWFVVIFGCLLPSAPSDIHMGMNS